MKNVINYFKGKDPLKQREDLLFELIENLDKESFNLYSEIMDLDYDSLYKLDNLKIRSEELYRLYLEVNEGYDYLNKIELSNYDYAAKRLQSKRLIGAIMATNLFWINSMIAILSFLIINLKANKDFAIEIEGINNSVRKFDEEKLNLIKITLDNCSRILKGKIGRLNIGEDSLIVESNNFIEKYINGELFDSDVEKLPIEIKSNIMEILNHNLNLESNNIYELLIISKQKNSDSLKLIKEY